MPSLIAPKRIIERTPPPQPGQRQAIEQLDRDLIVSAGAGSGKTWVLTERYVEMLNNGTHPDQIIAITFTKKAAAEMKNRIRASISKMAQTALGREEAAYWNDCKQALEQAVITTIHGFCTRLLRDEPLAAGIDPDFRVLDETESGILERQVFSETVDAWLGEGGVRARCLYHGLGDRRAVYESALALHTLMRTHHVNKEKVLRETIATLEERKTAFKELREKLLQTAVSGQTVVHGLITAAKKKIPKYLSDARHWLTELETLLTETKDWDGVYDPALCGEFMELNAHMWRNHGPEELKQLHGELKQLLGDWLSYTEAPEYRELLAALLHLTDQAATHYRERKRREQALDFNDLEQLSFDMLVRHPEVAKRWQQRMKYLMVDEFQDTNGLQKGILDQITGVHGQVKRFVVGDGKQSIYKFRGADVTVFNRMDTEIRQRGGEAVTLDVNFRTQERLIAYVNDLFHFLSKQEEGNSGEVLSYQPLVAYRKPPHTHPAVELLVGTVDKDRDTDRHQMEAERVATRLQTMVHEQQPLIWEQGEGETEETPRAVTYGDVALLFATRTHLHVYERALKNRGIPYFVSGGRGFYERQEVLDVLNVLKLVQNRDDELALLGFLRAPFVHLSDETLFWLTRELGLRQAFFYLETMPEEVRSEEWERLLQARARIRRWERMKQTEGVYHLLRAIVDETDFISILLAAPDGEQAALNVYKLLDMARDIDGKGYSLFDFLEWMDTLREEEMQETEAALIRERGDSVVLMTIHASKGLEFPVVVLPELSRRLLQGGLRGSRVLYTPKIGLAVKMLRERREPAGDGLFDHLWQMEQERERQEAYRLFYVAVTRARDYLLLSGSQEEQKNPREDLKHEWLDWVVKHLGAKQLSELPAGEYSLDDRWSVKITWDDDLDGPKATEHYAALTTDGIMRPERPPSPPSADAPPLYESLEVHEGTGASDSPQSVSALMDYTTCQRLYVLKHCLRMPLVSSGQNDGREEGGHSSVSAIEIGNVLHRVMERVEVVTNMDEWIAHACDLEGVDPSLRPDVTARVRPLVVNYCRSEWFKQSQTARRVQSELPFHYRLGTHTVSGVIDKLIVDEQGQATILDFKTNRIVDDAQLQPLVQNYKIQVQVYAAVVWELLHIPVKEAWLYFLYEDNPVKIAADRLTLEREKPNWLRSLDRMRYLSYYLELPTCKDHTCPCQPYLVTE